jgi:hypothetical protein
MSAKTWTLSVLAVPVLYILSVSPIACLYERMSGRTYMTPRWLMVYAAPQLWLCEHTPLKRPIQAYSEWCDWLFSSG